MDQHILSALHSSGIPNFNFFRDPEVIENLPRILQKLLDQDILEFQQLVDPKNTDLVFEDLLLYSDLDYLWSILNHLDQVDANEALRKVVSDFRPLIDDFANQIAYSQDYYQKLLSISASPDLDTDQQRILTLKIKEYQQRGIDLPQEQKEKLIAINKELSELGETFQHHVSDDQSAFSFHFPDASSLAEAPKSFLEKAEKMAGERGGYLIDADPSSLLTVLQYCDDASSRKIIHLQMNQRATQGNYDNRPLALKILQLTHQKSQILNYPHASEMLLWDTMAKNPDQVRDFQLEISAKAMQKAEKELDLLKSYFTLSQLDSRDVSYFTRKYKAEKYQIDEEKLKEYFAYDQVLERLFQFVERFLGVQMRPIQLDWKPEHEQFFEVYHEGQQIAYFFLDPFYRKGKRPGAWADFLRVKTNNQLPLILNVCNFQGPTINPSLLSLRDVETLFHEFGHALHAMLSESPYFELSGFAVAWDFVELPSQLMENWVVDQETLPTLAKHYQTGNGLSEETIQTLVGLNTFMKGVQIMRQTELALVDLYLYSSQIPEMVADLDQKILEIVHRHSVYPRGEEYKQYCSFLHIFGGGYASKYYSYMRAERLEAEVFAKIKSMGMFSPEAGALYKKTILTQGARKPAEELFFDFMGRALNSETLIKRYGFE